MLKKTCLALAIMTASSAAVAEDWQFGIGTGFFGLNIDGDIGTGSQISKVDLSSSDVSDLMESAFGFTGYAKKGKWTINYTVSHLELEDSVNAEATTGGNSYKAKLNFTADGLDVNAAYQLNNNWSTYFGVRNTTHEIDFDYAGTNASIMINMENDWTDVYVGLGYAKPLGKNTIWNTKVDIGGGDSEGSTTFNTGIAWKFSQNWLASFYAKHYSVEYENGSAGDADWYLYDSSEFGAGVGIMYNW